MHSFRSLRIIRATCLTAMLLAAASAHAAVAYDESVSGDLSNDRLNPTVVPLQLGVNSLIATTGFTNSEDREYVRIDLPANTQLSKLLLQSYSGENGLMFIGIESGSTFTLDPENPYTNIGDLLGWAHFGPSNGNNNGDDLLPGIGMGGSAQGFTPPLKGSPYTIWLQQFDSDT